MFLLKFKRVERSRDSKGRIVKSYGSDEEVEKDEDEEEEIAEITPRQDPYSGGVTFGRAYEEARQILNKAQRLKRAGNQRLYSQFLSRGQVLKIDALEPVTLE